MNPEKNGNAPQNGNESGEKRKRPTERKRNRNGQEDESNQKCLIIITKTTRCGSR